MKEVFERVYKDFVELLYEMSDVIKILFAGIVVIVFYITVPIWGFLYWIYSKIKRSVDNG